MTREWWSKGAMGVAMACILSASGCGYNDLQGLDEDVKAAYLRALKVAHHVTNNLRVAPEG